MSWVWSDELADALTAAGVEEGVVALLRRPAIAIAVPGCPDPVRCAAGLCGRAADPDRAVRGVARRERP